MILKQEIRGDKLTISLFTEQDISEKYLNWLADKEINRFLEVRFKDYSQDAAKEYVQNCIESPNVYFLKIEYQDRELIGTCTIYHNRYHKTAEIGLMIGEKSLQKKGFGSEVIRILTNFCCCELGVRKVTAGVYATNHGSIKSFLKNGFSIECKLLSQVLLEGKPEDVYLLAYFCK